MWRPSFDSRGFLVRDATGQQIHDARWLEVADGEAVIDGDPASPDYAALTRLVAGRPGITRVRQHLAGDHADRSRSDRTRPHHDGDNHAQPR